VCLSVGVLEALQCADVDDVVSPERGALGTSVLQGVVDDEESLVDSSPVLPGLSETAAEGVVDLCARRGLAGETTDGLHLLGGGTPFLK